MFSYYGRKSKIVSKYPPPIYDTIIEPFAGSAAYSLHNDNWKKKVILVDKDPIIISTWLWLQSSSPEDILNLPDFKVGDNINSFDLNPGARQFCGFWLNTGSAQPKLTASKRFKPSYWTNIKRLTAENIPKIKHWDIRHDDYLNLTNIEATWFIDPPYFKGGKYYRYNKIDYTALGLWCKDRLGQVIVCENSGADWLPFKPLINFQGQSHKTLEVIYLNETNIN